MVTTPPVAWQSLLKLNPDSVMPLYHQLKERLREATATLEPGSALPSEKELTHFANVSRATVRKALADLAQEGFLYSRRGRGTFTAYPRVEASLDRPIGFTEAMTRLGRKPSTKVLSVGRVAPISEVARRLRIDPADDLFVIERLRLIDGEPCMVEKTHLPGPLVPGLGDRDLSGSLYQVLSEEYDLRPSRGIEAITAVNADRYLAALLDVPIAAALIATARTTETETKVPLEFTVRHARGDLCSFRVSLNQESTLIDRSPNDLLPLDDHISSVLTRAPMAARR